MAKTKDTVKVETSKKSLKKEVALGKVVERHDQTTGWWSTCV